MSGQCDWPLDAPGALCGHAWEQAQRFLSCRAHLQLGVAAQVTYERSVHAMTPDAHWWCWWCLAVGAVGDPWELGPEVPAHRAPVKGAAAQVTHERQVL